MELILRVATIKDRPTLLDFEQGVIEVGRPYNSTTKEGEINYYNINNLIISEDPEILL